MRNMQVIRDALSRVRYSVNGSDEELANAELNARLQGASQQEIERAKEQGIAFAYNLSVFDKLIHEKGVLSQEAVKVWREETQSSLKKKYEKSILFVSSKELSKYVQKKDQAGAEKFYAECCRIYADLKEEFQQPIMECEKIAAGAKHALWDMNQSPIWNVYLDESGTSFDDENGTEGRIAAVAVPEKSTLRRLPETFHSTNLTVNKKIQYLNELLSSECGVFGLSHSTLPNAAKEIWYAMVLEVLEWILLLLPVGEKKTIVNFHIEQRKKYDAKQDAFLLKSQLTIFLDQHRRANTIVVQNVEFSEKSEGHLGWPDLIANIWHNPHYAKALNGSGLMNCLFQHTDLMPVRNVFFQKPLSGEEWLALIKGNTPIYKIARQKLQEQCDGHPEIWSKYVGVLSDYLNAGGYSLDIVDRCAKWFKDFPLEGVSKELEYYFLSNRVIRDNHRGKVDEASLKRLEELGGLVARVPPEVLCHTNIRLAVSDSDRFDFQGALNRLAGWNPSAGGILPEGAIWRGKMLSSIGQYMAFLEDERCLDYFEKALLEFALVREIRERDGEKQFLQTAAYAGIAAVDFGKDKKEVRKKVNRALDDVDVREWVELGQYEENVYAHQLVLRWLNKWGAAEDKQCYLKKCSILEHSQGHPWSIIQFNRWKLAPSVQKKQVAETVYKCIAPNDGPAVKFICLCMEKAMGLPLREEVLQKVFEELPLTKTRFALPLEAALTFNYR